MLRRVRAALIPVAFCATGLLTGHGPIFWSRFKAMQLDEGDSRFVNYLLEHGWRWLLREPHHLSFWDPEYFFPAKNVGAYAESMLADGPFYWIWRALGAAPDTSFQLWLLTVSVLNFTVAYLFLSRALRFKVLPASAGAFLFAFACSRINQTMHHQLFPQFFSVIAVWALVRIFSSDTPVPHLRAWIIAFFLAVTAQIYASIYLGWFLVFTLGLAFLIGLVLPVQRAAILRVLRAHAAFVILGAVVAAGLLSWVGFHYFEAARVTGGAAYSEVAGMMPVPQAWFHVGPYHWLYGWTSSWPSFSGINMEHEQRIGLGYATIAMVLAGLVLARKDPRLTLFALVVIASVVLVTPLSGDLSPWRAVYEWVPGAKGIRAVCRIAIALLLPAAVGLATLLEWISSRVRALAWGLAALAALEQGETTPTYDLAHSRADIAAVAHGVDPTCPAFFYSPVEGELPFWKYQLDAMWASLETGVPTLNGYSRTGPPGWGLNEPNITFEDDEARLARALADWRAAQDLDRICWVKLVAKDGPNRAEFVSESVLPRMTAGESYDVTVTMRNSGDSTWTQGAQYRLGSQQPQDNATWGLLRVDVPHDVPPGAEVTFRFKVKAPDQPGRHAFRWRMLREMVLWFGFYTEPFWVEVLPKAFENGSVSAPLGNAPRP